jgi:sec-independent protein translocase protein TatB
MFFDIGWSELLVIGVVALVFIGPKDLPRALRVAGYWFRKARTLSREFQNSVDQMIREAELDEMREQLKKATEFDINKEFQNTVDPTGELAQSLKPPEIPDFFEPASSQPQPAASETAATLPAAADTASAEAAIPGLDTPRAAEPEQPSLPFDAGAPAASEPEKVPVARDPEPRKP